MKKSIAILLVISCLFLTAGTAAAPASTENSLFVGFEDGELHLERTLTRGQFAKVLCDAFPDVVTTQIYFAFPDLPQEHWATPYIQKAANAGWISGFEDGTVRPDESVTFEQAVTVVCNALGLGKDLYDYPTEYIASAIDYSLTDGMNCVIGEDLTREQAVKLLANTLSYKELQEKEEEAQELSATVRRTGGNSVSKSGGIVAYTSVTEGMAEDVLYDAPSGAVMMGGYPVEPYFAPRNTEEYSKTEENIFKDAATSPLSTFSIDTDTASYSNLRRMILNGQKIPAGAVRSEELINYFDYAKAETEEGKSFGVESNVCVCPWNDGHLLARVTVSGEELKEPKPSNIVFLIDVSGSMSDYNKLPLVKQALSFMLEKLQPTDRVSIVTYASGTEVVLEPTPVSEKETIIKAMRALYPWGGTYGEGGIELAYELAEKYKIDGNNRIILCTDGDFNIGKSSDSEIEKLIEQKRKSGIFLSVLGFGMGNYKDSKMEILADKGNGNYAYIDNLREAKKVLADEMPKTIYTIAKDVKIQVEFNPAKVAQYRLVGYENRLLNNEDFENDQKDAGELGAGATVTVLYEIVPQTGEPAQKLKYQTATVSDSDELMTVKIRYKQPQGTESMLSEYPVASAVTEADEDTRFAAAVAELGMILNESAFAGSADLNSVIDLARSAVGSDPYGIRSEFLQLADLLRYRAASEDSVK